jgi:tetratricopeptide (TPR) repeat protein
MRPLILLGTGDDGLNKEQKIITIAMVVIVCLIILVAPRYVYVNGRALLLSVRPELAETHAVSISWSWVLTLSIPVIMIGGFLVYLAKSRSLFGMTRQDKTANDRTVLNQSPASTSETSPASAEPKQSPLGTLHPQQRYQLAKSTDELLSAYANCFANAVNGVLVCFNLKQEGPLSERTKYADTRYKLLAECLAIGYEAMQPRFDSSLGGQGTIILNQVKALVESRMATYFDIDKSGLPAFKNMVSTALANRLKHQGSGGSGDEWITLSKTYFTYINPRDPNSMSPTERLGYGHRALKNHMGMMTATLEAVDRLKNLYPLDFLRKYSELYEQEQGPAREELVDLERKVGDAEADGAFQAVQAEEETGILCRDDIIDAYRKIIREFGNHPKTRRRLGQLYYDAGCYYGAKAELEEAKRLDPSLAEDELLKDCEVMVKVLDALKPRRFVPKGSVWEYGVFPEQLKDGEIIDDTTMGEYRAISLRNPDAWRHDRDNVDEDVDDTKVKMLYRFKTLLYKKGEDFPFLVLMMESSSFGTTCISSTHLGSDERRNHGPTYKGMCYEEYKYRCIGIGQGDSDYR